MLTGCEADQIQTKPKLLSSRRSLETLRNSDQASQAEHLEFVKWGIYGFLEKLQKRYPFTFAPALRGLNSEINRQVQERLATHFLIGAIAELSGLPAALRDRVWDLGGLLCKQIGRGGDNFYPKAFDPEERTLAETIGEKSFGELLLIAEELSMAMKFKLGPVNSAEHVLSWCFRYVGQLLKAAKWESHHSCVQVGQP